MKLDRMGQVYGQLQALYDTGKRTKKHERVWAARCLSTRNGSACGRIIETHKLGQKDGPVRCSECSTSMYCQLRDIAGQEFSGWKAIKRTKRYNRKRDIWQFRCLRCGRRLCRNAVSAITGNLTPCRKCNPLPKPPQKTTPTDYPALTAQIATLRTKLAAELSAGNVVEVPVGGGRYSAFVSAADAPRVLRLRWYVRPGDEDTFYADTKIAGRDVPMHRFVLGVTDPKTLVDHKDHCGINNTRSNVRPATNGQNAANRRKSSKPSHSPYKGVTWQANTKSKPWMAYIHTKVEGKRKIIHLGRFAFEADAARAYNDAALERFGEFACLNDVPERKSLLSIGLKDVAIHELNTRRHGPKTRLNLSQNL
jgi:hypothetical protein